MFSVYNLHCHKPRQRQRDIPATGDKWGRPGARGWAREKEFAPSFRFNEAPFMEARWKSFPLLSRRSFFFLFTDRSCPSAFKALSVSSQAWLFYYSTTIIPPVRSFFLAQYRCNCGAKGRALWIFQARGGSPSITLHYICRSAFTPNDASAIPPRFYDRYFLSFILKI